jgi:hypothetical protein
MKNINYKSNHERSMMDNNELKSKLTKWMLEEGVTYSQIPDPDVEFRLSVTWGFVIEIVKAKELPRLISTASFSMESGNDAFKKLSDEEKREFFTDLRIHLLQFPIGYTFYPETLDALQSVVVNQIVYLEDLTKTALIESLDVIRRSMALVRVFSTHRLNLDVPKPDYYV